MEELAACIVAFFSLVGIATIFALLKASNWM